MRLGSALGRREKALLRALLLWTSAADDEDDAGEIPFSASASHSFVGTGSGGAATSHIEPLEIKA